MQDPDSTASTSSSSGSWRPGFWTGLGLGGLAAAAATRNRRQQQGGFYPPQMGYAYDYDPGLGTGFARPARGFGREFYNGRGWDDDDRGVGSSSGLGAMRESTGFGGTRNR
uniref:Uncharacterized protein n=1 Tax=Melanopsichium pennsylvanicum 4 TaxID=1398559 RepID=A0A077RB82_9BASI|nr:uncharacterized protein BN887_06253 [Melanopsichium pennsylvanicum 4]